MFRQLRQNMGLRALSAWLKTAKCQRKVHTLATARTIGLVFDASADAVRRESTEWAKQLEKEGKKVQLLGYLDQPKPPATAPEFDYFFEKELAWDLRAKSPKALAFEKEAFDMLLCINPNGHLPIAWVAAQSKAAMKIGMVTELPNDLDMQVDTPADKGVKYFAEQLRQYLTSIR
jgi:hypothetical protein